MPFVGVAAGYVGSREAVYGENQVRITWGKIVFRGIVSYKPGLGVYVPDVIVPGSAGADVQVFFGGSQGAVKLAE